MPETVLIGDLELTEVTEIRIHQSRKLAAYAVPGWSGDLIQDLGEAAARIDLRGIVLGDDAGTRLEELRGAFASGEPLDFVSSASVATEIEQTLLEKLDVVQSGHMPGGYAFSMALRRYVPPPPPMIGGFDAGFLGDLSALDDALALDAVGGLADALGTAAGALDAINEIAEFIEDAIALVEGAVEVQALIEAAGKVIAAFDD